MNLGLILSLTRQGGPSGEPLTTPSQGEIAARTTGMVAGIDVFVARSNSFSAIYYSTADKLTADALVSPDQATFVESAVYAGQSGAWWRCVLDATGQTGQSWTPSLRIARAIGDFSLATVSALVSVTQPPATILSVEETSPGSITVAHTGSIDASNYQYRYSTDDATWTQITGVTSAFTRTIATGLADGLYYVQLRSAWPGNGIPDLPASPGGFAVSEWSASETITLGIVVPVNTVAPSVTDPANAGDLLTVNLGTWTDAASLSGVLRIDGVQVATYTANGTYQTASGDAGGVVTLDVTATSSTGATATAEYPPEGEPDLTLESNTPRNLLSYTVDFNDGENLAESYQWTGTNHTAAGPDVDGYMTLTSVTSTGRYLQQANGTHVAGQHFVAAVVYKQGTAATATFMLRTGGVKGRVLLLNWATYATEYAKGSGAWDMSLPITVSDAVNGPADDMTHAVVPISADTVRLVIAFTIPTGDSGLTFQMESEGTGTTLLVKEPHLQEWTVGNTNWPTYQAMPGLSDANNKPPVVRSRSIDVGTPTDGSYSETTLTTTTLGDYTVYANGLLANCYDPEGSTAAPNVTVTAIGGSGGTVGADLASSTAFTLASGATLKVASNGAFEYATGSAFATNPATSQPYTEDETAVDTATVTISDGVKTSVATFRITLYGAADRVTQFTHAPVIPHDAYAGDTITLAPGQIRTHDQTALAKSYSWRLNETAVSGANAVSFTIPWDATGDTLDAVVTGTDGNSAAAVTTAMHPTQPLTVAAPRYGDGAQVYFGTLNIAGEGAIPIGPAGTTISGATGFQVLDANGISYLSIAPGFGASESGTPSSLSGSYVLTRGGNGSGTLTVFIEPNAIHVRGDAELQARINTGSGADRDNGINAAGLSLLGRTIKCRYEGVYSHVYTGNTSADRIFFDRLSCATGDPLTITSESSTRPTTIGRFVVNNGANIIVEKLYSYADSDFIGFWADAGHGLVSLSSTSLTHPVVVRDFWFRSGRVIQSANGVNGGSGGNRLSIFEGADARGHIQIERGVAAEAGCIVNGLTGSWQMADVLGYKAHHDTIRFPQVADREWSMVRVHLHSPQRPTNTAHADLMQARFGGEFDVGGGSLTDCIWALGLPEGGNNLTQGKFFGEHKFAIDPATGQRILPADPNDEPRVLKVHLTRTLIVASSRNGVHCPSSDSYVLEDVTVVRDPRMATGGTAGINNAVWIKQREVERNGFQLLSAGTFTRAVADRINVFGVSEVDCHELNPTDAFSGNAAIYGSGGPYRAAFVGADEGAFTPYTIADALVAFAPKAAGPLDLGGGVSIGAINLDGTFKGAARQEPTIPQPSWFTLGSLAEPVPVSEIVTDGTITATITVSGDDWIVNITEPAGYVGEYTVAGAVTNSQTGPVEVVAPSVTDDGLDPLTFTAVQGVWAGANDTITTVREWLVNGVVAQTGGATYERDPADATKLIEYRERAMDSAGERTGTVQVAQAAAFPAVVQFRSSFIRLADPYKSSSPFGPTYATTHTLAMRFTLRTDVNFLEITEHTPVTAPLRLASGSPGTILDCVLLGTTFPIPSAFNVPISLLFSADAAGIFSGGKTAVLYGKIGAGAWGEIGSVTTAFSADNAVLRGLGSVNNTATGREFDLEHWLWADDTAMEPSANYTKFFNADGTVKDLGLDGTAGGLLPAPNLYMRGEDFIGSGATLPNSGTQGTVERFLTPINVVFP